ncbi:MAG: WD40 repeat domain-containing protein [Myxococcota bacterium]|nr:WD40 repeat domain-containing protein [Myxococcota bacterium]
MKVISSSTLLRAEVKQDDDIALYRKQDQTNHLLQGHENTVTDIAFSPDEDYLASASCDLTARVWDTRHGALLRTLEGHRAAVTQVAFSNKKHNLVLTASEDHKAYAWSLKTGEIVRSFEGHKGGIFQLSVSPDGETMTTCSRDDTERIWVIETGELLREFTRHQPAPAVMKRRAEPRTDGRVLARHRHPLLGLAFSDDGGYLATMTHRSIRLWNGATGQFIKKLSLKTDIHDTGIECMSFSRNRAHLAIQVTKRTVEVWDVATGRVIMTIDGCKPVFSPDGTKLAVGPHAGMTRGNLHLWDIPTRKKTATLESNYVLYGIAFSADSSEVRFASITYDNDGRAISPFRIDAWSQATKKYRTLFSMSVRDSRGVAEVRFSSGHQKAVVYSAWNPWEVLVIDLVSGEASGNIIGDYERQLYRFLLSSCSSLLATTAAYDHETCLWDVDQEQRRHSFMVRGQNMRHNDVAFSPCARLMAAASQDGHLRVWSTQSGGLVYTSPKQSTSLKRVLFSPGGDMIAFYTNLGSGVGSGTASHDNVVRLVPTASMF